MQRVRPRADVPIEKPRRGGGDTFIFGANAAGQAAFGHDTIIDFSQGQDHVGFDTVLADFALGFSAAPSPGENSRPKAVKVSRVTKGRAPCVVFSVVAGEALPDRGRRRGTG